MEANAPEKLYLIRNISTSTSLNTTNDHHDDFLQEWYKEREKDTDIEYTRADVFIEKAFEFFGEHLWEYIDVKNSNRDTFINIDGDKLKEDFNKYIKGE